MKYITPLIKKKKISLLLLSIIISLILIMWVFYALFGHPIIESIYKGESIGFLNRIIEGNNELSLEFYIKLADLKVAKISIYILFPLCLFFLILVIPKNWRLAVFSICFCLLVIEGGFHIYNVYLSYKYPDNYSEHLLWEYDPVLGWKKVPNLDGYFSSKRNRFYAKVHTNAKGLRDENYTYEKDRDTSRILLLGDSFIVGLEVNKEDLIDTQLENLLNKHKKDKNHEVINAGTRGYGTDQSYLFLRDEGFKYSPDIIIYVFSGNDPMENMTIHKPYRKFGKSYFMEDESGQLNLTGVPVPRQFEPHNKWLMSNKRVEQFYNQHEYDKIKAELSLLHNINNDLSRLFYLYELLNFRLGQNRSWRNLLIKLKILPNGMYKEESLTVEFVHAHEWRILNKLLLLMQSYSYSIGAKFIVYESDNGEGEQKVAPTKLKNICNNLDIEYFNSFNEFYENSKGKKVYCFPFDGHWNARGHKLAAESIYQYINNKVIQ